MYRPTDRRIPAIEYSYQAVNPNLGRMPRQQGKGFMSGVSQGAKTLNNLNKISGGKIASGLKGFANKGLGAMGLPTFSSPISAAAPITANASPAASEMALAAQSAGYVPEFGLAGTAAAPTASSIASGATSMGAPAASLAAAEAAGTGASAAGTGASTAAGTIGGYMGSAIPVIGGIIAAATMGHQLTGMNTNEYEGIKTGDAFTGDWGTEPVMALLGNTLGNRITAGEAFDAARQQGNKSDMRKRLPSTVHQWAAPGADAVSGYAEQKLGKTAGTIADPIGAMWRKLW